MKITMKTEGKPLMQCGHTAQGTDASTGKPVCVICIGIPVLDKMARTAVLGLNLEEALRDRRAICAYCKRKLSSHETLPFFEHKPEAEYDSYYCGCRGWD